MKLFFQKLLSWTTARRFHRDESAQVTVFFLFACISAVLLLGFILNTAGQTSRKIQMQGAADAGAVASGVWVARGMNLTALNNKGMADIFSVMLVVRAVKLTAPQAQAIIAEMIAATTAADVASFGTLSPEAAALIDQLSEEEAYWSGLGAMMKGLDEELSNPESGTGWLLMGSLDRLNQTIKTTFPAVALLQTAQFANMNGADQLPYGLLRSGMLSPEQVPVLPLGRGKPERITDETDLCILPTLEAAAVVGIEAQCTVETGFPCISPPLAALAFYGDVNFSKTDMLWPPDPPRPMLLTDNPQASGTATFDDNSSIDYGIVQHDLEFLAVTFGQIHPTPIGPGRFKNPAPMWLTYGQANVYNPEDWNMFNQNWQTKLSKATLLSDSRAMLGVSQLSGGLIDFSYVNTH